MVMVVVYDEMNLMLLQSIVSILLFLELHKNTLIM